VKLAPGQVIAVVGLSAKPDRPSYDVARAMQRAGFRIIPVNPQYAGQTILDRVCVANLSEIDTPVHIVDCFRRSEDMPQLAREVVAMKYKPHTLWMQMGIESAEARAIAEAHGIEVIEDRCIKTDFYSQQSANV
jgi:uncharacterized protein